MDIYVVCEACGTELETPDASIDALLRVTVKARPCTKCSRPPDCHLSCEDVLGKEKEVIQLKRELAEAEKTLLEAKNLLLEWKQKATVAKELENKENDKPECFGRFSNDVDNCSVYGCNLVALCMEEKQKNETSN